MAKLKRIRRAINRVRRRQNFLILHDGRCGSEVVGDLLSQHPDITYKFEYFHPIHEHPADFRKLEKAVYRHHVPFYGYDERIEPIRHLSRFPTTLPDYIATVRKLGFERFIIMNRRNLLRVIISRERYFRTGRAHSTEKAEPFKIHLSDRIRITSKVSWPLVDALARIEEIYAEAEAVLAGDDPLYLWYEDHVQADPRVAYRMICDDIGARSFEPEVRLQRTNPFATRDVIENADEVAERLAGTRYEWMLDD